jgi:universal stress protein E
MKCFKNILFVIDYDSQDCDALNRVVALAEHNQANLTVVSILDEFPGDQNSKIYGISINELQEAMMEKRRLQLERQVASVRKKLRISTKVIIGTSFMAIIREVLQFKRDLLIKVAEKEEGVIERFFGTTEMRLLRKCPCPVWLMKSCKPDNPRKILAAVDFGSGDNNMIDNGLNRQIIEMSTSLALSEFTELHIVHVWNAYGESNLRSGFAQQTEADVDNYVEGIRLDHKMQLDELLANFTHNSGKDAVGYLKPKVHMIKGDATTVIPELVKQLQISFVLMGTVGRTGIPGFIMGNTAEKILNRIDCSVLAFKPEGFITPVAL